MGKETIFGIKHNDKFHYIGKTNKDTNELGNFNSSDVQYQYRHSLLRNVCKNNETKIIPIKVVDTDEKWYDEKLLEVVQKYAENNPLLNAQFMLEGKRGFWEDKERDSHTLQMLSESKCKRVAQFDINGYLLKLWNSGKDVAEKIFKDYKVTNGSGKTRLYHVLNAATLKGRLRYSSYWFWEDELVKYFSCVPKKLNIAVIKTEEVKRRCASRKKQVMVYHNRYTINHFDTDDNIIHRYENIFEAAFILKTSIKTIQRLCRNKISNELYILRYGVKTRQLIGHNFPKYTFKPLQQPFKPKRSDIKTRTKTSVIQYDDKNQIVATFSDINDASNKLGIKTSTVGYFCRNCDNPQIKKIKNYVFLRYGRKIQTIIS